jgi:hypothetical protein
MFVISRTDRKTGTTDYYSDRTNPINWRISHAKKFSCSHSAEHYYNTRLSGTIGAKKKFIFKIIETDC